MVLRFASCLLFASEYVLLSIDTMQESQEMGGQADCPVRCKNGYQCKGA